MRPILVFDVETTGRNTKVDEVIEFAGIVYDLDTNKILLGFDKYCWTPLNISYEATTVHGITKTKLAKLSGRKPLEAHLLGDLKPLLSMKLTFVAFNSAFDLNITNTTMINHGYDPIDFGVELRGDQLDKMGTKRSNFCLMKFFNRYPGMPKSGKLMDYASYSGLKISEVREEFNKLFPDSIGEAHSALFDSYVALQAFRQVTEGARV